MDYIHLAVTSCKLKILHTYLKNAAFRQDQKFVLIKSMVILSMKNMQIYHTTSKVKLRKFGSKIPVVNVVKTRKKLRKTLLKFFFQVVKHIVLC